MNAKKTYKNPPIIERVIGVYTDIKPEVFEARMPEWAAKIQDQYPIAKPIAEWSLHIKEINGVPMLQNGMSKAEIIQLFWKRYPKGEKVKGMRLRPNRLVFHLCREEGNVHDFEELYAEMEAWIGKWMEHFEVTTLKGVTAEYVNLLNAAITPQFMAEGRLKIADAFVMFSNVPGKYGRITAPYDSRMRLIVDEERPCSFDLRVRAENELGAGVRIDFVTDTISQQKAISANDSLAEIRLAHDVILEQFDCLFTEKAKNSFGPLWNS